MNSPAGKIHRRIFTLDGSNNVDSHNGAHFGVLLILLPILGVKSPPKKINFGGVNGCFQAKWAKY